MRTIVFFDLPNIYAKDRRNYLKFRKFLLNEGFIMMQESVYSKIVLNSQQSELALQKLRKKSPGKLLILLFQLERMQLPQFLLAIKLLQPY